MLAYSSGNFGKALVFSGADLTILFLLTDVLGLSGARAAGLMLFAVMGDLVFDLAAARMVLRGRAAGRGYRWMVALAAVALVAPLGSWYLAGVAGVALLLAYEQSLVRPDDLSRVKQAFDLNGYVGLFYLTATAAAIYVG